MLKSASMKILELWSKMTIPQAIAVAAMIAGGVMAAVFVPEHFWDKVDYKVLLGVAIAMAGGGASPFLDKLFKDEKGGE